MNHDNQLGNMQIFNAVFPHLAAPSDVAAALSVNVDRRFRFKLPSNRRERSKFIANRGTIYLEEFRIVGIQFDYMGKVCYRAVCDAVGDTFGLCVDVDQIEFID